MGDSWLLERKIQCLCTLEVVIDYLEKKMGGRMLYLVTSHIMKICPQCKCMGGRLLPSVTLHIVYDKAGDGN